MKIMKKKKILFISSSSVHTKKMIDMLEGYFDIYLITNNKDIFQGSQIKNIFIWKKNKIANILYTFKILKEIKVDLIAIQQLGLLAFFYLLLLHRKYEVLLTAWGSDILIFPYRSWKNMLIVRFSLKKATYLSTVNSIGMISTMKCLSNFKKEVIPIELGISNYIEFEADFTEKENIIFSPRGHIDLYNIENIILSFLEFKKKNTDWKLYIAGLEDPINTLKYRELVNELKIENDVKFCGNLPPKEYSEIMKKSKIVVSIPCSDGRPITVMEAISSNCTLICSDILANRELVSNRVNGFLVNPLELFDLNIYWSIDIDLQTKYNYKISNLFQYEEAKRNYITLFKKILKK